MAEPILWKNRDAGEKFSIVMLGLCASGAAIFAVYAGITSAIAGDWIMTLLSVGFVGSCISILLKWRRGDAR